MTTTRKARTRKTVKKKQATKSPAGRKTPAKRGISVKPEAALDGAAGNAATRSPAEADPGSVIALDPVLGINTAAALRDRLVLAAGQEGEVVIDASSVESADTACLQVLLVFVNEMSGQGRKVNWQKTSDGLLSDASILGLDGLLGLR